MNYTKPSFSVNPSGGKAPENCKHGWINDKGRCVLCGHQIVETHSIGTRHTAFHIDGLAKR